MCGTTGWLARKPEIEHLCEENDGTFFYASNFSVGVNIFFKVNEYLAKMLNNFSEYDVEMDEIHHTEKRDAPSGTAITPGRRCYAPHEPETRLGKRRLGETRRPDHQIVPHRTDTGHARG